jgi:hypothetical protein
VSLIEATADDLGTNPANPLFNAAGVPQNLPNDAPGNGHDNHFGFGRINVWKATLAAVNGGLPNRVFQNLPQVDEKNTRWYGFKIITSVKGATVWIDNTQLRETGAILPDPNAAAAGGTTRDITAYAGVRSDQRILMGIDQNGDGTLDEDPTSGVVPVGNNGGEYIMTFSIERTDLVDAEGNFTKTLSLRRPGDTVNDASFYNLRLNLQKMRDGLIPGVVFDDFVFEITPTDFGDAFDDEDDRDDFPTFLVTSNGARHLNTNLEWFGKVPNIQSVSPEQNAGQESDTRAPDASVDPDGFTNFEVFSDRDRFDNGVTFFPLTYKPSDTGKVEFTVCVADKHLGQSGRYRASGADRADEDHSLYVNAWIDWNTNRKWEEDNNEHIIDGFRIDPSRDFARAGIRTGNLPEQLSVVDNCSTFRASFPIPATIGKAQLWSRFRLDYGEDAGRNDPRPNANSPLFQSDPSLFPVDVKKGLVWGAARFGEVEDYLIGSDFGDSKDPFRETPGEYPTLKANNGARHLDINKEWLGTKGTIIDRGESLPPLRGPSVTREIDADDPPTTAGGTDQDNQKSLDPEDTDGLDDGVVLPSSFTLGQEATIHITVTSSISTRGFDNSLPPNQLTDQHITTDENCKPVKLSTLPAVTPETPKASKGKGRYDPYDSSKRLYLNAWADWNGDGDWTDAGEELFPGGLPIDPVTFGKDGSYTLGEPFTDSNGNGVRDQNESFTDVAGVNSKTFNCKVTPTVAGDEELASKFYLRYRLDYGENGSTKTIESASANETDRNLNKEKGAALFGEVEDYKFIFPDFGDAPDPFKEAAGQYPSRLANNGARHKDFGQEWLGARVDGEADSRQVNADRFDDGVFFNCIGCNPGNDFEKGKIIAITIIVTTSGLGAARYDPNDPKRLLYLNAWFDWDGNGIWEGDEKELGTGSGAIGTGLPGQPPDTIALDPVALGNSFTVTFPVTPNDDMISNGEFYARFRLDYGEDAGRVQNISGNLDQEKGEAQFGEVEDYRVVVTNDEGIIDRDGRRDDDGGIRLPDYGDAYDDTCSGPAGRKYPSCKNNLTKGHAKHLDIQYEWLGNLVSGENDSKQPNADDDDGVTLQDVYVPGARGRATFKVSVSPIWSQISPPGSRLYVSAWFDFNHNDTWDPNELMFIWKGGPGSKDELICCVGAVLIAPAPGSTWDSGTSRTITIEFDVPSDTPDNLNKDFFARFRLTFGAPATGPTGDESYGEVEDWPFKQGKANDFGDAYDDTCGGPGGRKYPSCKNNPKGNAQHGLPTDVWLGDFVDAEIDSKQPNADNDDGVVLDPVYVAGEPGDATFTVTVDPAYVWGGVDDTLFLSAWFDWNHNDNWEDQDELMIIWGGRPGTGADAWTGGGPIGAPPVVIVGLGPCAGGAWPAGVFSCSFTATFTVPEGTPDGGSKEFFARFRLKKGSDSTLAPTGIEPFGEVEDWPFRQGRPDFGDAPDPFKNPPKTPAGGTPGKYPSLLANNGARHLDISKEFLGSNVNGELDSKQVNKDEFDDGVTLSAQPVGGQPLTTTVTVTVTDKDAKESDGSFRYDANDPKKRLYLNAWADWDGDGDWEGECTEDGGPAKIKCVLGQEKIIGMGAGKFAIDPRGPLPSNCTEPKPNKFVCTFTITPPKEIASNFYCRFRLDYGEDVGEIQKIDPDLNQDKGPAQFGEVEDYPSPGKATFIDLLSFTAMPGDGQVHISWTTGAEINNYGFNILRSVSPNEPFEQINPTVIPAMGISPGGATYKFMDTNVSNGKTYYYRLEDIDNHGMVTAHNTVSATPMFASKPPASENKSTASSKAPPAKSSTTSASTIISSSEEKDTQLFLYQIITASGSQLSVARLEPEAEMVAEKKGFSFKANGEENQIILEWVARSRDDGYYLWRSEEEKDETYTQITDFLLPAFDMDRSEQLLKFEYTDATVTPGVTYYYKLEALDVTGKSHFVVKVTATPLQASKSDTSKSDKQSEVTEPVPAEIQVPAVISNDEPRPSEAVKDDER